MNYYAKALDNPVLGLTYAIRDEQGKLVALCCDEAHANGIAYGLSENDNSLICEICHTRLIATEWNTESYGETNIEIPVCWQCPNRFCPSNKDESK